MPVETYKGFEICELFKTVSLLNSEIINKIIRLEKLRTAKKNLKNSNSFKFFFKKKFLLFKHDMEVININNEIIKQNKSAKLPK